jgi:calcineurin-like phosphoesterase family protein
MPQKINRNNKQMKIEVKPGQNVYLTSDTHYNHPNICLATSTWSRKDKTRDFKSLSYMNQTMVNNINSTVGEDDILIHFGDWSFGGIESIWEFRKQIICKNIYLLFGNHDEKIIDNKVLPNCHCRDTIDDYENINDGPNPERYRDDRDRMYDITTQQLFLWCGHYANFDITYPQIRKDQKKPRYKFVASHFPIHSWDELGKGRIHFHGHSHLIHNKISKDSRAMDVGMDGNNYFPYELKGAYRMVKDNPIGNLIIKEDHHLG